MTALARLPYGAADFSIRVSHSIEAVQADWLSLTATAPMSPFQSYELMQLFYAAAEKSASRPIFAVVSRSTGGAPVALFPMQQSRHGLLRRLTLADLGVIDYGAPLIDTERITPADIDGMMAALMGAMRADYLYINKMPERLGERANPMATSRNRAMLMLSAWTLPLGHYAEVVATRRPKFTATLERCIRKLTREHRRDFALLVGPEVTQAHFVELAAMRAIWFASKGRGDVVSDPAWTQFYRALSEGRGGATQAWIATLRVDDAVLAIGFGLLRDGHAMLLLPASQRGDWNRFVPGLQLIEEAARAFAARGVSQFDLSVGDSPYKLEFGATRTPLYDAVYPASSLGWLYFAYWKLKTRLRAAPRIRNFVKLLRVNQRLTQH